MPTLTVVGSTVKAVLLVARPPGPVTTMVATPACAAAGTTKVSVVALTTVGVAAVPFTVRAVTPVKLVPVSVTVAPGSALVGATLVMVGATTGVVVIVNGSAVETGPLGVPTTIRPLGTPLGTTNVRLVSLSTVYDTLTLPSCTAVAPVKRVPVTVTVVPAMPLVGVKLVIVGRATGSLSFLQLASHKLPSATLAPV